jgi:hypothetical protein
VTIASCDHRAHPCNSPISGDRAIAMHITLFRALQGIRVAGDEAETVVDSLDTHVESVVQNNIKAVEAELVGIRATLEALKAQLQFTAVLLGVVGLAIAAAPIIVALAIAGMPVVAKMVR